MNNVANMVNGMPVRELANKQVVNAALLVDENDDPALGVGKTLGNVGGVLVTADADITQLITVTTAGTPVQGPNKTNPGGWILKVSPTNTVPMRFMFHGQTASAKGYPMSSGEWMYIPISNLSDLDFDADTGGNGSKIWACKC